MLWALADVHLKILHGKERSQKPDLSFLKAMLNLSINRQEEALWMSLDLVWDHNTVKAFCPTTAMGISNN